MVSTMGSDENADASAKRREVESVFREYLAATGDLDQLTEMHIEYNTKSGWTCTFTLADGMSGEYRYFGKLEVVQDDKPN